MPSNQSNASVYGARPASVTTPVTRPGSRAPHASACGPPPEAPIDANRPTPNASATAATSAAADATSRPGFGLEPPYDGRPYESTRMPRAAAAASTGSSGAPVCGDP